MLDIEVTRDHAVETLIAVGIFVGGLALARLVQLLLRRIVHVFTRSTERQLDERIAGVLRLPLAVLVIASAAFIALRTLSYLDPDRVTVERIWGATVLVVLVLLAQRLTSVLLFRTSDGLEVGAGAPLGRMTPIVRRVVNVAILVIGLLMILDQLGISISPLLAGLGISGIAVALALQPLLTNLFAGSYMMSDSSIRDGDYVTVQNGPSGYVIDIGWRATRLRTIEGELVIVPNATLAAAIVTNHGSGRPEDVSLVYPIPYGHDLERVEHVAVEVLRAVVSEREDTVQDFRPRVRFQRLGDGRVECFMQVRARSRLDAPVLTHVLIKRVYERFQAEGFNPQ